MSVTELSPGIGEPDDVPLGRTSWEALRADHRQYSDEYQSVLEMVPPWGQDLLVRLRGHHSDSFAHSLRVAATIDVVLEGESFGDIPPGTLTLAAFLHDVGKDVVPLRLLDKNGPLTEREREEVKPHALQSFAAIQPYDLVVAQLAGGHHLHQRDPYGHDGAKNVSWDAAMGQQLLAVADAVDALGSARSYKPAWPADLVRTTMLAEGNHSPMLIHRVVDARFGMPSFDITSRDRAMIPQKNIVFTA